jgi:glycosyltransferase involved in cell wall biosynthesis
VRRRIVLFTPGHAEPGGAQRRSRVIAAGLAARGWDVRVVTRAGSLRRPRLERSSNLTVIEVPGFDRRRVGGFLFLASALPLGIVWGRHACAFIAIQLMSTATAGAVCSLVVRRPFLGMATTSGRLSEVGYIRDAFLSGLRCRLLGRASWLIAQTASGRDELATLVSSDRVAVIPNPAPAVAAPPSLRGDSRVLFSGRFSEEKDLFRLLRAWRTIAAERHDARLVLAGAGGSHRSVERGVLEAVAGDPVLRRSVVPRGWVADMGPLLSEADVFVLPSLEEGMSNALLEACAWQRIVVASDIPSNREVLGHDYPLLFRAGDTKDLEAKLRAALADDPGLRAGVRRRLSVRMEAFTLDSVIHRLEGLISAANSPRD